MEHPVSPLHVLILAPHPSTAEPVPDRRVVESLYDALEAQGEQIEAEWLWPPTLDTMVRRFETGEKQISVVCLDTVVRQSDGTSVFLLETQDEKEQVLEPATLATLMRDHGIPLLLLSLRSEEGQVDAKAIATQMASEGAPHVIVLDDGLQAESMEQALRAFFSACLAGQVLSEAVADAVKEIPSQPGCPSAVDAIKLFMAGEDMALVSATTDISPGVGKIIRFPSAGLSPAWRQLAGRGEPGGLPPEPDHRFVGRGAEMAWLERALWDEAADGPIWIHGYEGIGKTSLVAHAARWLVRTRRFEQVVYTNFLGGGLPESALYDLRIRLVGEELAAGENPVESVEQALVDKPTLIIWDNMEAILPGGEFALQPEALQELLQIAHRYARIGRSKVCLLSDTLALPNQATSGAGAARALLVNALDARDARRLLAALLAKSSGSSSLSEKAWELVDVLGGHPLALTVLAPLIAKSSPSKVLEELEAILPGTRAGEARLRNQAVDVALQYLINSLGDGAPKLYAVGLFAGGFMEALAVSAMQLDKSLWDQHKERLAEAQLLHTEQLAGFNVPFVRLHPTFARYLDRRIGLQQRKHLEERYCGGYIGMLNWLAQIRGRSPGLGAALARCELPNFRRALRMLQRGQELTVAQDYVGAFRNLLETMGLTGERDLITSQFEETIAAALPNEGPLGRPGVQLLIKRGEQLYTTGRLGEAGALLQHLYERMKQEKGLSYAGEEAATDQARVLHRLGRCLYTARRVDAAQASFVQALELLSGVQADKALRRETLALYESLAEASLTSMEFDRAEDACQKGLEIATELGDEQSMGALNAQLGTIAIAQEDLSLARERFQAALGHLSATDNHVQVATVWSQLGTLAWRESDLTEAERCYSQALELAKKIEHPELQARVSVQMAQLAEQAERPKEAEERYSEAIHIYHEHNVRPALASTQMALANLLLHEGELQDARVHAEAARVTLEGLENVHPWEVYVLLRRIATAEGDEAKVAHWRLLAQEAFADSPEAKDVLKSWETLIQAVANSCRGESLDLEVVERVEKLEGSTEWQLLAQAVWQILGGARGPELYAELDQIDALVVRNILTTIETPPSQETGEDQT